MSSTAARYCAISSSVKRSPTSSSSRRMSSTGGGAAGGGGRSRQGRQGAGENAPATAPLKCPGATVPGTDGAPTWLDALDPLDPPPAHQGVRRLVLLLHPLERGPLPDAPAADGPSGTPSACWSRGESGARSLGLGKVLLRDRVEHPDLADEGQRLPVPVVQCLVRRIPLDALLREKRPISPSLTTGSLERKLKKKLTRKEWAASWNRFRP